MTSTSITSLDAWVAQSVELARQRPLQPLTTSLDKGLVQWLEINFPHYKPDDSRISSASYEYVQHRTEFIKLVRSLVRGDISSSSLSLPPSRGGSGVLLSRNPLVAFNERYKAIKSINIGSLGQEYFNVVDALRTLIFDMLAHFGLTNTRYGHETKVTFGTGQSLVMRHYQIEQMDPLLYIPAIYFLTMSMTS